MSIPFVRVPRAYAHSAARKPRSGRLPPDAKLPEPYPLPQLVADAEAAAALAARFDLVAADVTALCPGATVTGSA